MAYTVVDSVSAGDFGKAAQWNQMRTNQEHFKGSIDAATGEIETDKVTADSIAAGAVGQSEIASSAVGAGELKLENVTGSLTADTSHQNYPDSIGQATFHWAAANAGHATGASLAMGCTVSLGTQDYRIKGIVDSGTVTVNYTIPYHQACPPHYVGGELWGLFVYLLRERSTGEIIHYQVCVDPLWCRDESMAVFPKEDPRNAELLPHPWHCMEISQAHEVVLVDTRAVCLDPAQHSPGWERYKAREATGLLLAGETKKEADFQDWISVTGMEAARLDHRGTWDAIKDTPVIRDATRQLTNGGKPVLLGARNFDGNVTIVTA